MVDPAAPVALRVGSTRHPDRSSHPRRSPRCPATPAVAAALALSVFLLSSQAWAGATSASYDAQCSVCHQRAAVGAAGQFPRLAGRVALIAANPAGRAYLVEVVRNGLSGTIKVDGATIAGLMPAFPQLQAEELAAILNYLTSLAHTPAGKSHQFSATEVKRLSTRALSSQQLQAERESLVSTGVIP